MSSSAPPPVTEDTRFAGLLTPTSPTSGPLCLQPPLPGTFFLQFASWPIHLLCPFPAPFPADIFFMAFLEPYHHYAYESSAGPTSAQTQGFLHHHCASCSRAEPVMEWAFTCCPVSECKTPGPSHLP